MTESQHLTREQVVYLAKAWQQADRALTPLFEVDPAALAAFQEHVGRMDQHFPPGSTGTAADPLLGASETSNKVLGLLATLQEAAEQTTWVGFADAAQFWEADALWLAGLIDYWAISPQDLR